MQLNREHDLDDEVKPCRPQSMGNGRFDDDIPERTPTEVRWHPLDLRTQARKQLDEPNVPYPSQIGTSTRLIAIRRTTATAEPLYWPPP